MPSLSDKLKSLGVQVGAQNLHQPKPRNPNSIERVLAGHPLATHQGETFLVEERFSQSYRHGRMGIQLTHPLDTIGRWAGEARIGELQPQAFAFLDTETTGLSGGTGTYAFLIGAGKFEGGDFHLAQFFLRDPREEPAQLAALEEFLTPCQSLVTFNGKAFDVPLLKTRYIWHGWQTPFEETAHIDLLHLARRLWRDRLPNRALGSLEQNILGHQRSEEDVPGWMIPSLYFQYLRDGDARPLKRVFYHNAIDVVSMAALLNHMAGLLSDPLSGAVDEGVDIIAMAKLFESMGEIDNAARLYIDGLEHDLPKPALLEAIEKLAAIYKHQEAYPSAIELWQQAAQYGHIPSYEELAKYYEHKARDYETAKNWTEAAIRLVSQPGYPAYERYRWIDDLEHRLDRLQSKLSKG